YKVRPDLRAMGPRLGAKLAPVRKAFDAADGNALRTELLARGAVELTVNGESMRFPKDELEVLVTANPGFAAAGAGVGVVVLATELTEALVDEGLVREVLAKVQAMRKGLDLGYTERIRLAIEGDERVRRVCDGARELIMRETLATELTTSSAGFPTAAVEESEVNGLPAKLSVGRAGL
ncbi:MAG TPA: DUF5915 domain-containing protein, partial [Myxococcaceae bacterium]|nr:DUF5915 domain-containing protein [Myxococcaceae bacterium]